jgi:hypothetical protein
MREAYGRDFEQGGIPHWTPLKPATIRRKQALGLPKLSPSGRIPRRLVQRGNFSASNILIETGKLRDSYRQKGVTGHVEIFDVEHGTVEVGSRLKTPDGKYSLAAIHQHGTQGSTYRRRMAKAAGLMKAGGKKNMRQANKLKARAASGGGIPARPVTLTADDRRQLAHLYRLHIAGASLQQA